MASLHAIYAKNASPEGDFHHPHYIHFIFDGLTHPSDILKRHTKIHTAEEIERRQALLRGTRPDTIRHADQRNGDGYQHHHVQLDTRLPENPGVQIEHTQPDSEHQNIINPNPIPLQSTQGNGHLTVSYGERLQNRMHGLHGTVPQNPMMIPSPESVVFGSSWSDGYYGIYGEGSFDADLAWILDMAPMSPETIQRMQERLPVAGPAPGSFDTSLRMPQQLPQQGIGDLSAESGDDDQTRHQASIENRNNWPDEDELPGAVPTSVEGSTYVIPDSRSWVEWVELSSPLKRLHDAPAQSYTVSPDIRARLIQTLIENASLKDGLIPPEDVQLPVPEVLEYFLKLFFEHVQIRFPVIHRATFSTSTAPSFLLLSMMLLGSSHSRTNHGKFVAVYLRPVVIMFQRLQALDTRLVSRHQLVCCLKTVPLLTKIYRQLRSTDNILTLLFLCVSGAWCGHKIAFEFAEGARGILVTACRRCKLLDCRPKASFSDTQQPRSMRTRLNDSWKNWIKLEQRKRLGLCIFVRCFLPKPFS